MPHPLLQGTDINSVTEVLRGKCMPELVKVKISAVRPLGTFMAEFCYTLSAIQPAPPYGCDEAR